MTVETTGITPHLYTCNGATTEFPVSNFPFQDEEHLVVTKITVADGSEEVLTLDVDYTVDASDNVVITPALSSDYKIHIDRETDLKQTLRLPTLHGVDPTLYTNAWDKAALVNQEQARKLQLAITLPRTSELTDIEVPDPAAGQVIRWNAAADNLENVDISSLDAAIISTFVRAALDDTTLSEFLQTLGADILDAIEGLSPAANKLPYFTGADTLSLADITAFARTVLDDADAAAVLATLGITDVVLHDVANSFSAAQNYGKTTKTGSSGTVTIDLSSEPSVELTLSGDITLAVSNEAWGRGCELKVIQDATGGRTMGLDTDIDGAGYDFALNSEASAVTLFWLWCDGTKTFIRKLWEDD